MAPAAGPGVKLPGLRVGAVAFLLGTVAFGWVELREHPARWLAWVLANGVNLSMFLLALWARPRLHTRGAARAQGVVLVVAVAAVMASYTVIVHGSSRMLASGLIILLTGVSLLARLGVIGQAVAALGVIGVYAGSIVAGGESGIHLGLFIVALISAAGVSVLGTFLTERARRLVLPVRPHAARLTSPRHSSRSGASSTPRCSGRKSCAVSPTGRQPCSTHRSAPSP
jgi:hypothetical protein